MKNQQPSFTLSFVLLSVGLTLLMGCSSQRPAIYPNAHLQEVGEEQAEKDMVACEKLADSNVSESHAGGKVAGQTVMGSAFGAASGQLWEPLQVM